MSLLGFSIALKVCSSLQQFSFPVSPRCSSRWKLSLQDTQMPQVRNNLLCHLLSAPPHTKQILSLLWCYLFILHSKCQKVFLQKLFLLHLIVDSVPIIIVYYYIVCVYIYIYINLYQSSLLYIMFFCLFVFVREAPFKAVYKCLHECLYTYTKKI